MRPGLANLVLAVATALVVAGCGVRGSLEAPAQAEGKTSSAEAADAGPNSAAAPKPHRGFILDGLVR